MTETVQPTITIPSEAFVVALKHGIELWADGSTPTYRLDQREGRSGFTRYCNARVEGKMAEEAFVRFLDEYFDIDAAVDYDIYGDIEMTDHGDLKHVVGDDGDVYQPSVELDVKKTKPWNKWLAIRRTTFEAHPDDAPFVLTKLTLEDDLVLDAWDDDPTWDDMRDDPMFEARVASYAEAHFPLDVEIVGTAYPDEFTEEFSEGDRLYDPRTGNEIGGPLRTDNVGMPCDDLIATEERWNRVVNDVTRNIPITYTEL